MAAKKKAKRTVKKKAAAKKAPAKKVPAKRAAKKMKWASRKFKSLAQVRAAIDAMDEKIVPLLCERLYYVTQAAQFKPSEAGVVVIPRVEEVVNNAKRIAAKNSGKLSTVEVIYRALIDASTLDEQRHWRALHGQT
ncbi:MAG: chorismate mutase [Rhodospirillaceae bacterium]